MPDWGNIGVSPDSHGGRLSLLSEDKCPECFGSLKGQPAAEIIAHAYDHWPRSLPENQVSREADERRRALLAYADPAFYSFAGVSDPLEAARAEIAELRKQLNARESGADQQANASQGGQN